MKCKKGFIITALLLMTFTLAIASWPSTAQADNCSLAFFQGLNLTDGTNWVNGQPVPGTGQPITITSVTEVPAGTDVSAGSPVPAYCDVIGTMWPTIRFEVALPTTTWNGRLLMVGNGGNAGYIVHSGSTLLDSGNIAGGLLHGYATTGTDMGHCSQYATASQPGGCPPGTQLYPSATFEYVNYPTTGANPNWWAKAVDYDYLATHETIAVAKKMVQAYYAKPPAYTYWIGCSTGGRQGLMEAQRYPNDFNGILAGSAVNSFLKQTYAGPEQLTPQYLAGCNPATEFCGGPQIPPANLAYLGAVVYNKCDGLDGLVDGIIDDPRICHLDVDKDLTQCSEESYEPYTSQPTNCFTGAQLGALKQIYAGGFCSTTGKQIIRGTNTGGEAFSGGWSPWLVAVTLEGTERWSVGSDSFAYKFFDPQQPTFNYIETWNWCTDPSLVNEYWASLVDAIDPDLSGFYNHRGKLIIYNGWADVNANPLVNSLAYYEEVLKVMPQTRDFFAAYMVPGAGHCGPGGVGCGKIDWLTPLVNWVEKDQAPGVLVGNSTNSLYPTRTRPICRYPEVARWDGTGDTNVSTSFSCVPPIEVRIEPETLNLNSKGEFTAFITMPEGFHVADWDIHSVSCEGAPMVKGEIFDNTYIATFETQALTGVSPGKEVWLEVKLAFLHDGMVALTQGYAPVTLR